MRTYKKRIAFCLSDQHTIPHGGLGQFAKSFVENLVPHGYKIDIISDKPTSNTEFKELLEGFGAGFVYPDSVLPYTDHTKTFVFEDSYNLEKQINFRNSMMKALKTNLYDIVICNTLESFPGVYCLNIHRYTQVIYYTHNESMVFLNDRNWKNEFTESFNEYFNGLLGVKGITIGTQTDRNKDEMYTWLRNKSIKSLPLPMTELDLLNKHETDRKGVLWIGRWEPRKNPEAFVKMIAETKLPAKILTNTNGARKFEKAMQDIGAKYELGIGLVGQKKVDFITSARVAFNPALRESFGLAFFETMGHMPTVTLKGVSWTDNFDSKYFIKAEKNEVNSVIEKLYKADPMKWYEWGALNYVKEFHDTSIKNWLDCFNNFVPDKSNSDRATINEKHTVCYKDFMISLGRKEIAIDDIRSVLTNKTKFNIIYTDSNTYLSKDKDFIPEEKESNLESLFA
jgi:glycosyltransferase involved in cell wall biosynthesis